METIPLVNGQRLLTTKRTGKDGIVGHVQGVRPITGVRAEDLLLAPLKVDGSGSPNMNVDGSSTPVYFWHLAAGEAGNPKWTTIAALTMSISDDAAVIAGGFGGLAALTTGLALELVDSTGATVVADLTGGLGIKSHADFAMIGGDVRFADTATGVDVVSMRLDFARPIELAYGQRFRITVRDNLTGLTALRAFVAGDVMS